jgi:hypothetical protein
MSSRKHPLARIPDLIGYLGRRLRRTSRNKSQEHQAEAADEDDDLLRGQSFSADQVEEVTGFAAKKRARFVEDAEDEENNLNETGTLEKAALRQAMERPWDELDAEVQVVKRGAEEDQEEEEDASVEPFESEIDEKDEDMDMRYAMEDLWATVCHVHPNFLPGVISPEEAELEAQLQAAKNPLLKLNGLLSGFGQPPQPTQPVQGGCGKRPVPRIVIVSGHKGVGGNWGLNGIYERHTNEYKGHPVYQKFLERRAERDSFEIAQIRNSRREWEEHSTMTRILMHRDQRLHHVPEPRQELGPTSVLPALDTKFLFFAEELGGWCIGPKVGTHEVYARCPSAEDCVPFALYSWEVWDVGQATWYAHKTLKCIKAGD